MPDARRSPSVIRHDRDPLVRLAVARLIDFGWTKDATTGHWTLLASRPYTMTFQPADYHDPDGPVGVVRLQGARLPHEATLPPPVLVASLSDVVLPAPSP